MKIKTISLKISQFITDWVRTINENTQKLQTAIEDLYNAFGIDVVTKKIGSAETPVNSVITNGVIIKNGGKIEIFDDKGTVEAAATIEVDSTGKSIANFDTLKVDKLELYKSTLKKEFTENTDGIFDGEASDYIFLPIDAECTFNFENCEDNQLITVIIVGTSEATSPETEISSIKIEGGTLLNGYDSDNTYLNPTYFGSENPYDNQVSFIVMDSVSAGRQIMILK